jgi:hypothetical protein
MLNNEKKDPNKKDRLKANKAIKRTNTIKGIAKGLKGVKTITNALGTSPTETPDVNTTFERPYIIDKDGYGSFDDEKKDK